MPILRSIFFVASAYFVRPVFRIERFESINSPQGFEPKTKLLLIRFGYSFQEREGHGVRIGRVVLAAAIAASFFRPLCAADLKFIAHPSVKASGVTAEDIRRAFLLLKSALNGDGQVKPVLLRAGPAHQAFLREYIGRAAPALETYYRSLLLSGKSSAPQICANDAEMISYVASTKGAIGYVSAATLTDRVKTLEVK